jgi:hypothetical protein
MRADGRYLTKGRAQLPARSRPLGWYTVLYLFRGVMRSSVAIDKAARGAGDSAAIAVRQLQVRLLLAASLAWRTAW